MNTLQANAYLAQMAEQGLSSVVEVNAFGVYSINPATRCLHHDDNNVPSLCYSSGYQGFFKEGKRHREGNLPATIHPDGKKRYLVDGKYHRTDGPAIEFPDGAYIYMVNGRIHREDGPAVVSHNGICYWFIKGKRLTKEEFDAKMQ